MPHLTLDEHAADIAAAKYEGAKEIADLIARLQEVGLGIAALSGAIQGTLVELDGHVVAARAKADVSRRPRSPEPQPDL